MATEQYKQWSVVTASTLAFTVWTMFAVIGIPIKKMLDLNATQLERLAGAPYVAATV